MNNQRDRILNIARGMEPGQHVVIDGRMIREGFPTNPLTGRPTVDALLENLPGSNYGTYTVDIDRMNDTVVLRRHEECNYRVREDWDRRLVEPVVPREDTPCPTR